MTSPGYIKQECPHCQQPVETKAEFMGKEILCPGCQRPFKIKVRSLFVPGDIPNLGDFFGGQENCSDPSADAARTAIENERAGKWFHQDRNASGNFRGSEFMVIVGILLIIGGAVVAVMASGAAGAIGIMMRLFPRHLLPAKNRHPFKAQPCGQLAP